MLKVLLLGSSGLLGSAIKKEFAGYDLLSPSHEELDVTNFGALENYFNVNDFDIVINCTGYNAVDDAEKHENQHTVFTLNENVPEGLAKLSSKFDFKLIHFSSDYVFDGEKPDGYSEDSECSPINVYGDSKLAGELAVMQNCSKYFIVRISWLFGPAKNNFVTTMHDLANERDEISVVNDQFGKPTYTEDVAAALHYFTDSSNYGIYHLPNEGSVSWFEFANEIFSITGQEVNVRPVSSEEFKRLARRPKSSILLNSKLPNLRDHKLALEEYINNYL